MRRGRAAVCAFLLILPAAGCRAEEASAGVKTYTFSAQAIPHELLETAMQVSDKDVLFTLTFAGDCTLGGTEATESGERSFSKLVGERGMAYPFEGLRPLFAEDDFTVVNLEGVLSDSKREKETGRQFNFIGGSEYAKILSLGSVECVSLANNHTRDYGEQGYQNTMRALEGAGIAHFGEDTVTVLEKGGVRIGFTANLFNLSGGRGETLERQLEALRSVGCQWIVHAMHAGIEYADMPSARQRSMARHLAQQSGVDLVIGHHPHVVQGMELIGEVPVAYSLGNASFGGNLRPRDYDACVLRAKVHFHSGQKESLEITLYPIRISGEKRYNDYRPILLTGADAERVLNKMQKSSAAPLAPFIEGQGAVQPEIEYKGEGTLWQ